MKNLTKTMAYQFKDELRVTDVNKIYTIKSIADKYLRDIEIKGNCEYVEFVDGSVIGTMYDDYYISTDKEKLPE